MVHRQRERDLPAGRKRHHPSLRFLERARIGEVCRRLQTGDVAISLSPLLLPEGEAGERPGIPGEPGGLLAPGGNQERGGCAVATGTDPSVVAILGAAGARGVVAVPGGDVGRCHRIARHDLVNRRDDLGPRTEERRPEIDVIEHLHRSGTVGEIRDRIGPGNAVPLHRERQIHRHPQGVEVEAGLIDGPTGGEGAGLLVEDHLERPGGEIGDPAMKAIAESPLRREIGSAVAHQAAAGDELVEAVEPSKAGWLRQRHEPRMHRSPHRGLPAPFRPGGVHLPDAEPPIGEEPQSRFPGDELHHPDSLGEPADERPAADGKGASRNVDVGRSPWGDPGPFVSLDDRHHSRPGHEISSLMR